MNIILHYDCSPCQVKQCVMIDNLSHQIVYLYTSTIIYTVLNLITKQFNDANAYYARKKVWLVNAL